MALTNRPFIIVACGARKLPHPAPASELYTGNLHRAALDLARRCAQDDDIRIISAKYGLLTLSTIIEPYDQRLRDVKADKKRLGVLVSSQLAKEPNIYQDRNVTVLAGQAYGRALRWAWTLNGWPYAFTYPLEGLMMGQQIKWLREREAL